MRLRVGNRVREPGGGHAARSKRSTTERSSRSSGRTIGWSQPRRRRATLTRRGAECLEALREVGPDVHVGQFAAFHMRKMAKRVEKRRARWTAYGVKLTGKGEPR
jgi:hypothetical protein